MTAGLVSALMADAVVLVHGLFIVFAVLGALLLLRWPWLVLLHVPAVLWGAYVEFSGSICPLTPLENRLRAQAGEGGYDGGFIDHYLLPLIYPDGLTRDTQLLLGSVVVLINLALYGAVLWRWRRGRPASQ